MKFGLTDSEYSYLMQNLIQPLKSKGARVFIFGSRARGDHKKFSDIDLLYVETNSIPKAEIYHILNHMEESMFPYKIDLVLDKELAQSYRKSVEHDKLEL